MTERRALSEVLDKYAGLFLAGDSNWQQGEKVSAMPSAATRRSVRSAISASLMPCSRPK